MLTYNSLAHRPKINNLFNYVASLVSLATPILANYSAEPSDISLWHHMLIGVKLMYLQYNKPLEYCSYWYVSLII